MLSRIKKTDLVIIITLAVVFTAIILTNSALIFSTMTRQTEQIGQSEISTIKADFENYLSNAENSLIKVANGAEQYLGVSDGLEELEAYIIAQKKAQLEASKGANFNVYIARHEWSIIPDFVSPEDYHATERSWYVGAVDSKGEIYITDPYIDSMTGEMCYTLSVLLSDGETVVAMDFTLSEIQQSISRMTSGRNSNAMITTAEGLIVGYTDMSYVGKVISRSLPEYQDVLKNVLSNRTGSYFTMQVNGAHNTVFHSVTKNGWYMILCVNNSELFGSTLRQVALNIIANLVMLAVIAVLYVIGIRNRVKAEKALKSREHFVNKVVEKVRGPLDSILKVSDRAVSSGGANEERFAEIKASGISINQTMEDLKLYSSFAAKEEEAEQKNRDSHKLSGSIILFRNLIIVLLLVLMFGSSYLYYRTGIRVAGERMNRECDSYTSQFARWEQEQQAVLGMFTDFIAEDPSILDDYERAVSWMDGIAKNYSSISVCYLANPYREHTVIMNNGWQPDADWKVEERDWYRKTEKSGSASSISAPYYDEQTGNYCITISKIVYGKNREFLGIFGIDLYMDKIIQIFGDSYNDDEYVFLVDPNGDIINHPSEKYQMTEKRKVNIKDTPYAGILSLEEEEWFIFKDYDGVKRCGICTSESATGFRVVLALDWKSVYLYQIIYTVLFILVILVVIVAIILIINRVIRDQNDMNQRLTRAVRESKAAEQAKSDFLAQMSHEIRTPINTIAGMDEMILRESTAPAITEYAGNIQTASRSLLALINGVLDYSKLESGRMEITPVKYETTELIDEVVNMTFERAQKKGLELKLNIDKNLPKTMYGDDVKIKQIIVNLLTNAVKYTEKGSITLSVRVLSVEENECRVYVKVTDTGIGIRQEDRDKLFKSFQRLEEKRNRTIEGTGLGLSIVEGLLKLMGSSIVVNSTYGKGSSFAFEIRQSIINPEPIGIYKRHSEKEKKEEKDSLRITDAKILVVDDNEMNLLVAKGLMKKLNVTPELAKSGHEAVELVKKTHYDIILMDHMMPGLDGLGTFALMRDERLIGEDTAVIALTANATAGAREMYLNYGFKDYLSKPIVPAQLERILAKHLPEGTYTYEKDRLPVSDQVEKEEKPLEEEREAPLQTEKTFKDILEEEGFNVKAAGEYCMNDDSFYKELLLTFAANEKANQTAMKNALSTKAYKDYKTIVHSIKSASRTIGADTLSTMAYAQEMAAGEGIIERIRTGFGPLSEEYARVAGFINTLFDDTPQEEAEDDDIMDFYPE